MAGLTEPATSSDAEPGLLARLARQAHAGQVELGDALLEAVARQAKAAGAERVGLDDLRAGRDVGPMDGAHQVGVRHVQLGQRAIERDAAGVQHGAHRAVAHQHLALASIARTDRGRPRRSDARAIAAGVSL